MLGAGGMLMYSADCLRRLREICTDHYVLFIADEVMTNWGAPEPCLPARRANITPDVACYSKGLTGGSLPLAVTLCRNDIYLAHYSTDRRRTFFHSSSFTANPIACAAALANLEVWDTDSVRERVAALSLLQTEYLDRFRNDARFENVRQTGTITAMDLKASDPRYLSQIGPALQSHFRNENILLRPLGNTIYVLPPYCVTRSELNLVYEAIAAAAGVI